MTLILKAYQNDFIPKYNFFYENKLFQISMIEEIKHKLKKETIKDPEVRNYREM